MKKTVCPHCQEALVCGQLNQQTTCWCMNLPPLSQQQRQLIAPLQSCLCEKCLKHLIHKQSLPSVI